MSNLLHSAIMLGLWAVQGSHGRLLSEPTQRSQIADLDRPPAPTRMVDISEPRYMAKRQETSLSNNVYVVTIATDETCGWLSGRPALSITCENHHSCMWVSSLGIFCGEPEDFKNWQVHIRCIDREMALNPGLCNDTCQTNPLFLRCIEKSAAYCGTYVFPQGIQDYRCSSTPATRVSSVSFTYNGQKNAGFVTTTYTVSDSQVVSTKSASSTIPPSSSSSPTPPPNNNNIGAIIGGAIGGFVALALVILAIFCFVRRSKKDNTRSPTQVAPMEQAPLSGSGPIDPNAGKTGPNPPVQSDWRSSTMTVRSSPSNPASPQGWMDQPVSPSVQSQASQGVLQPIGQHMAYEMSGESVQPRAHEMTGDSTRPRVYEMVGDSTHPWV
ncbi:hypothetical protein FOQG_18316 [Fusarium oxysporum f. sp. raphani 54005]|uniref:Uncharacterized protein n=1 Tax=Fusarium oxysporum f. sp. raphani 54005 TaxID=1089458 RepID=X0BDQ9_FUSOX|nr:hypothetical protein FOQG_18316 [Fusarium oxysporum f. sp. raphani 54005]